MEKENYSIKRNELHERIKTARTNHYKFLYKNLSELLILERTINKGYTKKQIAEDLDMNLSVVYRVFSWKNATQYTKQLVREGTIGMAKVCRIISKIGNNSVYQNEVIEYIIKNKLTDDEMDTYITKKKIHKFELEIKRKYNSKYNVERAILTGCEKLDKYLLSIDFISKNNKNKILKALETTKGNIEKAQKNIKNM